MARTITSSQTSSASNASVPEQAGLGHLLALLGLGALLAFGHRAWDVDLGLPGHYGLVWMAGVMVARNGSATRWAATTTAAGYMGTIALLAHGAGASMQAPIYGLCALAVDGAWLAGLRRGRHLALIALTGGVAFMLKPLAVYLLAHGVQLHLGKLRHGPLFSLMTHFGFGAVGAVIGTQLVELSRRAAGGARD